MIETTPSGYYAVVVNGRVITVTLTEQAARIALRRAERLAR